jgi:hypothetical protein
LIVIIFLFLKKKEGMEINHLDGIDIVYWINLDRSPDRRKNMEKMFEDDCFSGILNQRISAVDGKNDEIYDMINTSQYNSTDSEYGCLLSHLNAIKTFYETDNQIALIMEDDCTLELKKYWKKSIKEIIQYAPNDWEIIMLSYTTTSDDNPLDNWKITEEYTLNNINIAGALSYIINKKGAKKLINDCDNFSCYKDNVYLLNTHTEHKADFYLFNNTITYCYKYPYFIYSDGESTIHNDHLDWHKDNKNRIINNYEKL